MQVPNLQVTIRVRPSPIQTSSKIIECDDPVIAVKNPFHKQKGEQSWEFTRVLDNKITQVEFFNEVGSDLIDNALEGKDSVLICYGQSGSGKSYTIIGGEWNEDRGLIPRSINYLFEKLEKRVAFKEISVHCRFLEIYLDKVRDLGKASKLIPAQSVQIRFTDQQKQSYQEQNLQVKKLSNGQVIVEGAEVINCLDKDEILRIVQSGIRLRESCEQKVNQIGSRGHSIFTLIINQKDRNNQQHSISGTVHYVDMAGSEKQSQDTRHRESLSINQSFESFYQVLVALTSKEKKNPPFQDNKLTHVLQNQLTRSSNINWIFHLNPLDEMYEETIHTLSFAEKIKQLIQENSKFSANERTQEKRIRKMQEEVYDLQNQADYRERHYEAQLNKIQSMFGFEFDIDTLLQSKIGSKELRLVEEQKEGIQKLENLLLRNKELENKLEQNKLIFEEIRRVEVSNQEKRHRQINQFRDAVQKLTEAVEQEKKSVLKQKEDELKPIADRWQKILTHSHMQLEEKGAYIFNIPTSFQNYTEQNKQLAELYEHGKSNKEYEYKKQLNELNKSFKEKLNQKETDFQTLLDQKIDIEKQFRRDFHKYYDQKNLQIQQIRKEMLSLYNYITVQQKILQDVHNGVYNQNIRPVIIPSKDIPQPPDRINFPSLYKAIEKQQKPTLDFQIRKSRFSQSSMQRPKHVSTIRSKSQQRSAQNPITQQTQTQFGGTTKSLTQLLEEAEQAYAQSLMYQPQKLPQFQQDNQLYDEVKQSPRIDLDQNITELNKQQLQDYIQQLMQALRFKAQQQVKISSQVNLKQMQEEPIQSYIQILEEEKQRYQSLYQEEIRLKNENKSLIESQRKIIERGIFITLRQESRPSTAQSTKRPGTGRPGTADLKAKQVSPYIFIGKDPLMTQINPQTLQGIAPRRIKASTLQSTTKV